MTVHVKSPFYYLKMKVFYYLKSYDLEVDLTNGFAPLMDSVANLVGKPAESIIICNDKNKRVTEETMSDVDAGSFITVYDAGRAFTSGMNKEGRCHNPNCAYFNRMVVDGVGFPSTERIHHGCAFNCPFCGMQTEVSCVIMMDCHYNLYTLSQNRAPTETDLIHASVEKPIYYDLTTVDFTEEYDFNVQRGDMYICRICHKKISNDHECARVHKRSLCGSCSK